MASNVEVLSAAVKRLINRVHELESQIPVSNPNDVEIEEMIKEIDAVVPEPVVTEESVVGSTTSESNMANSENPPEEEKHEPK
jgi:hypothetical protein